MSIAQKSAAEFFGTFWLVFGGCGSAIYAAGVADVGIGWLGVAFAFGLTVLTMAYAIGHISGCHLNPAVSVGAVIAGRMPIKDLGPYVLAQVIGAIAATGALYLIAMGQPDFVAGGFASNGFGELSPQKYSLLSVLVAEALLTFFFMFVILGSTDKRAPAGLAPIAIGLCLTLIHLVGIPIDNLSVNPARSTGPAIVAGTQALIQLWAFWVAPIAGAALAGVVYPLVAGKPAED
ncbi:MAG: aquaporin Z [Kiritimatiellia bacterium]|jgi:aquaporin Z